jgi:cytochrome P450
LNNNNGKWEKYEPYMAQFNSPGAVISTAQYDLHRMRRKPENNFFSRRSIVALEPLIYEQVERLCERMDGYKANKSPLTVNHAMLCFTGDVVSQYAFGESWHLLDSPDFAPWMLSANKKIGEYSHSLKQWPWLVHVLNALPLPWIAAVAPDVAMILKYQEVSESWIKFNEATDIWF